VPFDENISGKMAVMKAVMLSSWVQSVECRRCGSKILPKDGPNSTCGSLR
jgi:hypothetical protein